MINTEQLKQDYENLKKTLIEINNADEKCGVYGDVDFISIDECGATLRTSYYSCGDYEERSYFVPWEDINKPIEWHIEYFRKRDESKRIENEQAKLKTEQARLAKEKAEYEKLKAKFETNNNL